MQIVLRLKYVKGIAGYATKSNRLQQNTQKPLYSLSNAMMVESSGHTRAMMATPSTSGSSSGASSAASSTHISAARCGVLETRVRGAWYRVTVTLESDYLSVSLDETCDPVDHSTTLNGTLGYVCLN